MYSDAIITLLTARLGFGEPGDDTIKISASNTTGASGRVFRYFHQLVTVDNIYHTSEIKNINQTKFDVYLVQLKVDSVKAMLTAIFDRNELYQDDFDYSDMITSKIELFDDAIGLGLAITVIEQMISSTRMNQHERNVSVSYEKLKIELEGAKNEKGHTVASGIKAKFSNTVKQITKVIFPDAPTISSKPIW